jgi:death-on-curing protein
VTRYLSVDDALQIIGRYGFHVRDAGLLASALARPSASMFAEDAYPSLDRKAAALLESFTRDHPLLDGNKRAAWTVVVAFLWINGWRLQIDTDDAFDLVVGVAADTIDLDDADTRIAEHRVPR